MDAIRTSFQPLLNPTKLKNQLDLLRNFCIQNEVIEEAKEKVIHPQRVSSLRF